MGRRHRHRHPATDINRAFFRRYHAGDDIDEIEADLRRQFDRPETHHDFLLTLAYCRWETGSLNQERLDEIAELIESGRNLEAWRADGADQQSLDWRGWRLENFLKHLRKPRKTPRKRSKAKPALVHEFTNGTCPAFQYPDGQYGGAVIYGDNGCTARKGQIRFALTEICQSRPPVFADFENTTLYGTAWYTEDGHSRNRPARRPFLSGCGLYYDNARERDAFFAGLREFFTVVPGGSVFDRIHGGPSASCCVIPQSKAEYAQYLQESRERLIGYRNCGLNTADPTLIKDIGRAIDDYPHKKPMKLYTVSAAIRQTAPCRLRQTDGAVEAFVLHGRGSYGEEAVFTAPEGCTPQQTARTDFVETEPPLPLFSEHFVENLAAYLHKEMTFLPAKLQTGSETVRCFLA